MTASTTTAPMIAAAPPPPPASSVLCSEASWLALIDVPDDELGDKEHVAAPDVDVWPLGQVRHDVEPMLAWYCPAAQELQLLPPPVLDR